MGKPHWLRSIWSYAQIPWLSEKRRLKYPDTTLYPSDWPELEIWIIPCSVKGIHAGSFLWAATWQHVVKLGTKVSVIQNLHSWTEQTDLSQVFAGGNPSVCDRGSR